MPQTIVERYTGAQSERRAIERLRAHLSPKDHNKDTTLFEVGYEQAKKDLLEKLNKELRGQ